MQRIWVCDAAQEQKYIHEVTVVYISSGECSPDTYLEWRTQYRYLKLVVECEFL